MGSTSPQGSARSNPATNVTQQTSDVRCQQFEIVVANHPECFASRIERTASVGDRSERRVLPVNRRGQAARREYDFNTPPRRVSQTTSFNRIVSRGSGGDSHPGGMFGNPAASAGAGGYSPTRCVSFDHPYPVRGKAELTTQKQVTSSRRPQKRRALFRRGALPGRGSAFPQLPGGRYSGVLTSWLPSHPMALARI